MTTPTPAQADNRTSGDKAFERALHEQKAIPVSPDGTPGFGYDGPTIEPRPWWSAPMRLLNSRARQRVGEIRLTRQQYEAIRNEVLQKAPLETGGVVIGQVAPSGRDFDVVAVTGPGPNAIHERYHCSIDADYAQLHMRALSEDKRNVPAADWHSHPAGLRVPSGPDQAAMAQLEADGYALRAHLIATVDTEGFHLDGFIKRLGCKIEPARIVFVEPDPHALFQRLRGLAGVDTLVKREVMIVGAGSGNSLVVDGLVRAGVASFSLVDQDVVSTPNLVRGIFEARDVGRLKTEVLRDRILSINPRAHVATFSHTIQEKQDALEIAAESADLIICGTDSQDANHSVNRLALKAGKPAAYGAALPEAYGGDFVLALPGQACYACVMSAISTPESAPGAPQPRGINYASGAAAALPPQPALGVNVSILAGVFTKLCLDFLMAGTGPSKGNVLFYGIEPKPPFTDSFQTIWQEVLRKPGCPACMTDDEFAARQGERPHGVPASLAEIIRSAKPKARIVPLDAA